MVQKLSVFRKKLLLSPLISSLVLSKKTYSIPLPSTERLVKFYIGLPKQYKSHNKSHITQASCLHAMINSPRCLIIIDQRKFCHCTLETKSVMCVNIILGRTVK